MNPTSVINTGEIVARFVASQRVRGSDPIAHDLRLQRLRQPMQQLAMKQLQHAQFTF